MSEPTFGFVFPAIRGTQAGREYYVSMCPLRIIPRIFSFDEEELAPELRAQRTLNKGRIPEMARYILNGRDSYVFSALTASIDANVRFEPLATDPGAQIGQLHVPMDARFIINDGQHRRAAIETALRQDSDLRDETIAVVFFLDVGLERCQQMFADLNRHAIRPSTSLGVLYDHHDSLAIVTKQVVSRSAVFRDLVEKERTGLSPRSRKLFTLSSIYAANRALLAGQDGTEVDDAVQLALRFWTEVAVRLPEWQDVRDGKMRSSDVRKEFLHSHGVILQAIASAGRALLVAHPKDWARRLDGLRSLDWARANRSLWEGRVLLRGRVSKASQAVQLATNAIKQALSLDLSPAEQHLEDTLQHGGAQDPATPA